MARVSKKPYPGNWELTANWEEDFARQSALLADIDASQPDPGRMSLVGARLDFPRGDGYATYVVVQDKPLTLAHVPHGDAWQADECTLRGINAAYVRRYLTRAGAMRKLFGAPKKEGACSAKQ